MKAPGYLAIMISLFPLAGFPFSLELVEERTIELLDGDSKTEIHQSKVYRDAEPPEISPMLTPYDIQFSLCPVRGDNAIKSTCEINIACLRRQLALQRP
jgi:hypothetical protein